MHAPVYRHLDTKPSLLGLQFPGEWVFVIVPLPFGFAFKQVLLAFALALTIYGVFRVASHGKPDGHIYHWLLFRIRQRTGGVFSAAARAQQPRFPYTRFGMDARFRSFSEAVAAARRARRTS